MKIKNMSNSLLCIKILLIQVNDDFDPKKFKVIYPLKSFVFLIEFTYPVNIFNLFFYFFILL